MPAFVGNLLPENGGPHAGGSACRTHRDAVMVAAASRPAGPSTGWPLAVDDPVVG